MNDIIKITSRTVGDAPVQTVDARELHGFLEIGKMFAHWIKDRIEQYGFVENLDYVVFVETGNNPSGGRPAKEYALTLDMAKEIAMVERNAKGKQARQYFIECERRAKEAANQPALDLNDPAALRDALLGYSQKVIALQSKVQEVEAVVEKQAPKVEVFDRLAVETEGAMPIRRAAALLQHPERKLAQLMDRRRWIYKLPGSNHWCVHAEARRMGYMETKLHTGLKEDGGTWRREQVLVTPRGLTRLAYYLNQEQAA